MQRVPAFDIEKGPVVKRPIVQRPGRVDWWMKWAAGMQSVQTGCVKHQ